MQETASREQRLRNKKIIFFFAKGVTFLNQHSSHWQLS